jgi:hypothetical protein
MSMIASDFMNRALPQGTCIVTLVLRRGVLRPAFASKKVSPYMSKFAATLIVAMIAMSSYALAEPSQQGAAPEIRYVPIPNYLRSAKPDLEVR